MLIHIFKKNPDNVVNVDAAAVARAVAQRRGELKYADP